MIDCFVLDGADARWAPAVRALGMQVLLTDTLMHYCPGCGHGVVHKLLMEVVHELGEGGGEAVHRVVGEVRVSDVALHAVHREAPGERTAPSDLDRVAEALVAGGFADHAIVDLLAPRLEHLDDPPGAVHRRAFLVAGEQEREAARVPRFLKQMADNALRSRPPLNWRGAVERRRRVAFLGTEVARNLFGNSPGVGQTIRIRGLSFEVVGVLADKAQLSSYFWPDKRSVFIPHSVTEQLFHQDYLDTIVLQTIDPQFHDKGIQQVRGVLAERHRFDARDERALAINDSAEIRQVVGGMATGLKVVLIFIGTLKYRRMWLLMVLLGAGIFILPEAEGYVAHLISGLELRERTWVPAMVPWRATEDGFVTPEVLEWYGRFADGEPGAIVVEATGQYRTRAVLQKHLDKGAKCVVLTVPPRDELDALVVMGVNDHVLNGKTRIVSNASCTANALARASAAVSALSAGRDGMRTSKDSTTASNKFLSPILLSFHWLHLRSFPLPKRRHQPHHPVIQGRPHLRLDEQGRAALRIGRHALRIVRAKRSLCSFQEGRILRGTEGRGSQHDGRQVCPRRAVWTQDPRGLTLLI